MRTSTLVGRLPWLGKTRARGDVIAFSVVAALLIGHWSVWPWYIARLDDGSDEPWGLLALGTVFACLILRRESFRWQVGSLGFAAATLLGQSILPSETPALIRASLAMVGFGALIYHRRDGVPLAALLLLSLPVIASLQFYLGYWLRLITGHGSGVLLNLLGFDVVPSGVLLLWRGETIAIDPPCSGIRMLWFGAWFYCAMAAWRRTRPGWFLLGGILAFILLLAANTLRATLLFYKESGLLSLPEWTHEGCGLLVFVAASFLLMLLAQRLPSVTPSRNASSASLSPGWCPLFTILGLASAVLLIPQPSKANATAISDVEWPTREGNTPLFEIAIPEDQADFLQHFPGSVKVFASADSIWIYRWVNRPTRQLHPARDCYRAAGWEVLEEKQILDTSGHRWSRTHLVHGTREMEIHEQIRDANGTARWTEPSQWFWDAALGRSQGPWWMISRID